MATGQRDILREFLVALGFTVNTGAERKMTAVVTAMTGRVNVLGRALTLVGSAVAVERIASEFERLYYFSQKVGASAGEVMQLGYAFSQAGVSEEKAQGSLAAFAMELRKNPGKIGMLAALGVQGKDTVQLYDNLMRKLAKMPDMAAFMLGDQFGVSADMILAYKQNRGQIEADRRAMAKAQADAGLNPQQLAAQSKEFMHDLRELWMDISTLGQSMLKDVLPPLDYAVKNIVNSVQQLLGFLKELRDAGRQDEPGGAPVSGIERGGKVSTAKGLWLTFGQLFADPGAFAQGLGTEASGAMGALQDYLHQYGAEHGYATPGAGFNQTNNVTITGIPDGEEAGKAAGSTIRHATPDPRNLGYGRVPTVPATGK